jgi:hypothetical protein
MAPGKDTNLLDTFKTLIQDVSNNVIGLVKTTGDLSGDIKVLQNKIETLKTKQNDLESANRSVISVLEKKMDPDRCAHMHNDLEKRIMKNIKQDMKGWMKTAFTILKFATLLAMIFAGGSVGASALGWIKIGI